MRHWGDEQALRPYVITALILTITAYAHVSDLETRGAVMTSREAVDVCRMEMRFPNIEREITTQQSPAEVGLQWMVDREAEGLGIDALAAPGEVERTTVCWEGAAGSTAVPDAGTPVQVADDSIGEVVSAVRSPRCDRVVGTALVRVDCAAPGLDLTVAGEPVALRAL